VGPISFSVRRGEIAALVGLRGAGQEDVGRALFGLLPLQTGTVELAGHPLRIDGPPGAIASGIGFVAGDRTSDSIAHGLNVRENMFINPSACGRPLSGWRTPANEQLETVRLGASVGLSPNNPEAIMETLSGGNQQKVVMARWLRIGGSLLVLEDPTAGVDVGAKAEIYRLLGDAVRKGLAVLLVSTDFEEVCAICHRAFVFRGGRIVTQFDQHELTMEQLIHAASLEPAAVGGTAGEPLYPDGGRSGCNP
jgi:ribose transport system ATP-binding protein